MVKKNRQYVIGVSLVAGCILASCAPAAKPPVVVTPVAPKVTYVPRPKPPSGLESRFSPPQKDAYGVRQTVNVGISRAQTLWNLRSALNVAALNCRGSDDAAIKASYSTLLKKYKAPLASANKTISNEFASQYGTKGGAGALDTYMTKVYNFFAFPTVRDQFCANAAVVGRDLVLQTPATIENFAQTALPKMEKPFLDFYDDYDQYLADLAKWEAAQNSGS